MIIYDAQVKAHQRDAVSIGLFTDRDVALETCMSVLRAMYPDVDLIVLKESGSICMRGADTGGWEWFGIVYDRACDNPEEVKRAAQYLSPDRELADRVRGMLERRDGKPDDMEKTEALEYALLTESGWKWIYFPPVKEK